MKVVKVGHRDGSTAESDRHPNAAPAVEGEPPRSEWSQEPLKTGGGGYG